MTRIRNWNFLTAKRDEKKFRGKMELEKERLNNEKNSEDRWNDVKNQKWYFFIKDNINCKPSITSEFIVFIGDNGHI